jgi:hypothetical protein
MTPAISTLLLVACFGPLVGAASSFVPTGCPAVDPFDHTVLLADPTDCSRFFSCHSGTPIQLHCPQGLHFNDLLKVCDYPYNAKCVPRKFHF